MQDKILVSGFDPFGGEPVNPACELLNLLDGKLLDGYRIVTQEIPTARFRAAEALLRMKVFFLQLPYVLSPSHILNKQPKEQLLLKIKLL